ncbi:MAG: type IV pilus assembly protein PilM [Succinivibrionaceae bacterium]
MAGMKNKGNLYNLLGVDFGSQSIKAVAISGRSDNYQIVGVAEVPTPKGSISDYQIQDMEKVISATKSLIKHIPQRPKFVATSVSGSGVISKVIQVDSNLNDSQLSDFIESEAEQLIPFPLEEINLDYEVLGTNLNDTTKNDVLVSGARTESIEARKAVFDSVGMDIKVVDVSVHALARAIKSVIPGFDASYADKTVAIVDVGAVTLTFGVIYKGEVIYQRLQSFGGDNVTQNIATYYSMSYEDAEKAKVQNRLPGEAPTEIIAPYMNHLAQQIKRNIQLFTSSSSHREVDMVVLTGGTCLLPGLTEQLSNLLRLPVKAPDIFKSNPKFKTEENQAGYKYMIALGLALRSFEPCPI